MNAVWKRIEPWVPFAVLAMLMVGLVLAAPGCESRVVSLIEPDRQVTRAELASEVRDQATTFDAEKQRLESEFQLKASELNARIVNFNQSAEEKVASLDRQDAWKRTLIDTVNSVAMTAAEGTVNPSALLVLGISTLGGLAYGALGIKRPNDVSPEEARRRENAAWDEAAQGAAKSTSKK